MSNPPQGETEAAPPAGVRTTANRGPAPRVGELAFDYRWTASAADRVATDCVVVTFCGDKRLSPAASAIDSSADGLLSRAIDHGVVAAEPGAALLLPTFGALPAKTVLLLGTGGDFTLSDLAFQELVRAAFRRLTEIRAEDAALYFADVAIEGRDEYWSIRQQIVFIEQAAYRYGGKPLELRTIAFGACVEYSHALAHGRAMSSAITTARFLSDMPPNQCTPDFLGGYAASLADEYPSMTAEVLTEEDLAKNGMHAMLSVGRGSAQPSRLAIMKHAAADARTRPVVLVGKGVTFDTGGTAIKTRNAMRRMKYDMCGAATVIGVMRAAAMLKLPINLVGMVACAENMPDGGATRPSDVVTSMSGKTVEILNPDAEGRLLLCDSLTYAESFDPEVVIDVATLTGASLVALGRHYSAMFASDDELAASLVRAGEIAMDDVWRLPLSSRDLSQLDSDFADIANIGDGTAGCIVAGLFLAQFAGSYRWAHLDVSATAKKHGEAMGATGRPTALLVQFLLSRVEKGGSRVT